MGPGRVSTETSIADGGIDLSTLLLLFAASSFYNLNHMFLDCLAVPVYGLTNVPKRYVPRRSVTKSLGEIRAGGC